MWFPVDIYTIESFSKAPTDIYIKISEQKYIKIFEKDNVIDKNQLQKYKDKDEARFCIVESSKELLFESLEKEIVRSGNKKAIKSSDISAKINLVYNFAQNFVISESVQEEILSISSDVTNVVLSDNKLREYIEKIKKSNNIRSAHCLLTSFLAVLIAKDNSNFSTVSYQKLSMAGILHEIGIEENLFLKSEVQRVDMNELSWREIKKYKNHSIDGAKIIEECKKIPQDVVNLVLEHHEKPDGSGFPHGKNFQQISQLSATFIVADTFSMIFGADEAKLPAIKKFFNEYKKKSYKGVYKTPIDSLEKIIFK